LLTFAFFSMGQAAMRDVPMGSDEDPFKSYRTQTIADREDDYHKRRQRQISPTRVDAFGTDATRKTNEENTRSYAEVMQAQELEREQQVHYKNNF